MRGREVPACLRFIGMRTLAVVAAVAGAALASGSGGAASAPPCRATQLSAVVAVQGATSRLMGPVKFTNTSGARCTLSGRPLVSLAEGGRVIATSQGRIRPLWKLSGEPRPRGWPRVTLRPDGRALVYVVLGNWCGRHDAQVTLQFRLPGDRGVVRAGLTMSVGCLSPHRRPGIEVGPFEPARG
jgi:hypothetical protein